MQSLRTFFFFFQNIKCRNRLKFFELYFSTVENLSAINNNNNNNNNNKITYFLLLKVRNANVDLWTFSFLSRLPLFRLQRTKTKEKNIQMEL